MAHYVIVTESGGDIPAQHIDRWGLEIVPMHVILAGEHFDDGAFPPERLFEHYHATGELPTTSGCMPQDFEAVFERVHHEHPEAHILYLAYSAVTTCSYESALTAAKGRNYITFIDTKFVTAAQGMIVVDTARLIEEHPKASLDEIMSFVADLINRARMAFVPSDLAYLRAGGRLSNAAYVGAHLLKIKPVIEILDGKLVATKKKRGSLQSAAKSLMSDMLEREPMDKGSVRLIRSEGLPTDVMELAEHTVREQGFQDVEWINTGCVISSHCGPGTFGIAAYAAPSKQ